MKPADALFSKVLQRVLALLYGHPEQSFYTNEIIQLTKSGTGAIQRELTKLTAAGIITAKQIGNQKHHQANCHHPIFSEIHAIVMKTFGLADVVRDALQPISQKIIFAFIYGSIAKQEETDKSDIDLIIISNTLSYADLFPLLEKAEKFLSRKINPSFYMQEEWQRKHKKNNHFLQQIIQQPKIFLIGNSDALNKLR